jgi:prevent-host-death family protein
MKTVTAAQANRQFSSVLREVAQGQSVLVTSRGKPVATIAPAPVGQRKSTSAAKRRLLAHLRTVQPSGTRGWVREDLYG